MALQCDQDRGQGPPEQLDVEEIVRRLKGAVLSLGYLHRTIHCDFSFARFRAFALQIGHKRGESLRFFNWRSRPRLPGQVRDTFHSMPACVTTSISRAPIPAR